MENQYVSWRTYTDYLKQKPWALQLAEQLGRGRGQMRILDEWSLPPAAKVRPNLQGWENRGLSAVWIGHATLLLRIGGMTILTDPVFSSRIGLGLGLLTLGPRRYEAPALTIAQLPGIDLILSSHAHFDHLDRPSLARLDKRTPIIMADKTRDLVWDLGFRNVTELRWGESTQIDGVKITARRVVHWGARTFVDQYRGYNAYLLESDRHRILFGGDSAYQDWFSDIGGTDLAIIGIGAYDPYIRAHASPEQAWQMANHAGAKFVIPMHHSTFRLSHEPMTEPVERFLEAAGKESERIVVQKAGGTWTMDE